MIFGAVGACFLPTTTNQFSQLAKPLARPDKFDGEDCQPDRDNNECGSRRYEHHDAKQQNAGTHNCDHNAFPGSISKLECSLDHSGTWFSRRRRAWCWWRDAGSENPVCVSMHLLLPRRCSFCLSGLQTHGQHPGIYAPCNSFASAPERL